MVKIIVSSFYNTLINSEEAIPISTMLEIERVRKKGIVFSVCTNNLPADVLYYNRDFPFLDYLIALNGAYVYDVKKEKCIYQKKLSLVTVKKIQKIFSNYKLKLYTLTKCLDNIEGITEDIYKITVEIPKKKVDIKELEALNITYSFLKLNNKIYLELTSNLTNNLKALEKILTRNKISLTETLVIAGNEADLPLIKNIPNNYLVSNSPKELKEFASGRTKSNNLKGVEQVLKKI